MSLDVSRIISMEKVVMGCYYKITFSVSGNFYTVRAISNRAATLISKNGELYGPGSRPSLYFEPNQIIENISMEEATLTFIPKTNREAVKMLPKEE